MKRLQRGNLFRQQTDGGSEGAALMMEVCAKSSDGGADETKVQRFIRLQLLDLIGGEQRQKDCLNVFAGERCACVGCEGAVDAQCDGRASDEDDVGCVAAGGDCEELVERSSFAGLSVDCGTVELVDELRQLAFVIGHESILPLKWTVMNKGLGWTARCRRGLESEP